MVVHGDALEIPRQRRLDHVDVGRVGPVDLDGDQAGDGQGGQRRGGAEPWLKQLGGVLGGERPHPGHALLLGEEERDQRHLLFDVGGVDGIELDGDFAGDVVDPGVRRLVDHVDAAGGEAGEEGHDGDHHGERVAGDRGRRHDLRRGRLETFWQPRGERRRQDAGEQARPGIVPDVVEDGHAALVLSWPS